MIYAKEAERHEGLYKDYVEYKVATDKSTLRDVKRSRARLQQLNERVTSN